MSTEILDYGHLNDVALQLLSKSDEERIVAIRQGSWIPYTRAKDILERLEDLLAYPRVIRMPNMLIVGCTNNGKSHILHRFVDKHPPDPNPSGDAAICPVVFVEAPSSPDKGELYRNILDELRVPRPKAARVPELEHQVKKVLAALQVKILVIDEIQHLIAGGLVKQREFRNAIKSLGNELRISIVAAGVEEAFNAFNTDPQLSNRFAPIALPLWKLDDEFANLMATLERRIPLRLPSNLVDNAMLIQIFGMGEGILGEICAVVTKAAVQAIRSETECITLELLDSLNWIPPSKRSDKRQYGL